MSLKVEKVVDHLRKFGGPVDEKFEHCVEVIIPEELDLFGGSPVDHHSRIRVTASMALNHCLDLQAEVERLREEIKRVNKGAETNSHVADALVRENMALRDFIREHHGEEFYQELNLKIKSKVWNRKEARKVKDEGGPK